VFLLNKREIIEMIKTLFGLIGNYVPGDFDAVREILFG